jgi:tetratricopeptide (TPR) repeat protein
MMRKDSKEAYRFSLAGKFALMAFVSLLLLASCRSGPMAADERAKEATRLYGAGRDDAQRGDIDSAISKFEKVLQLVEWPQVRRDYAVSLYNKGRSCAQRSDGMWQRSLGKEFDDVTRTWKESGIVLSEEEKAKLKKDSDEVRRMGLLYFRKSLDQYQVLDAIMGGSDESVIWDMAKVHALLEEFDQAKACFERLLESPLVEEKLKEKIRAAIEAIDEAQKEQSSPSR